MKQSLLFIVAIFFSLLLNAQGPPPPCWFGNILVGCDEENAEFAEFNFTDANDHLFCNLIREDYNFPSYHLTSDDAFNDVNPITSYEAYTNNINPQFIYARIELAATNEFYQTRYFRLDVENCLSTKAHDVDQFLMYPNPTIDIVNITLKNPQQVILEVRDIKGKLVNVNTFSATEAIELDVSKLKSALYFITVHTISYSLTKRLIVK